MAGFILSMFISKKNDIALSIADRFTTGISEFVNKNGTYGTRLDESQVFLVKWYTTGFYSGIDPFYEQRNEATTLADVGYVYVLVSTGLIGLVLLALIWLSGIWFSLHSMNLLVKAKLKKYTIFPACFLAVILFFIVSQLYIQYNFIITVLAIAYGLAISTKKIFYDQVSIKK